MDAESSPHGNHILGVVDYYEDYFKSQEAVEELKHHKDTLKKLTMLYCDGL